MAVISSRRLDLVFLFLLGGFLGTHCYIERETRLCDLGGLLLGLNWG